MLPLILTGFQLIAIVIVAVVMFWVLREMKLPDPAAMIARIIVGLLIFGLLLSLFIPSLGVGLRLGS